MLISYSVKNFQSFLDTVSVDWSQNAHVPETDWVATSESGARVAKVMAVLGHNASGKTALLKSLVFLEWFISRSFNALPDAKIPVFPHFLTTDKTVEFEMVTEVDNQLWRYELRCNKERVLHEALYKKRERFSYVFVRDWDETKQQYKVKQQDFGFPSGKAEIACNQRQNASLISIAAQHGVPLAIDRVTRSLSSNIASTGRIHSSAEHVFSVAEIFANNVEYANWMINLLRSWDLGLSNIEFKEKFIEQENGSTIKKWIPLGIHHINKQNF